MTWTMLLQSIGLDIKGNISNITVDSRAVKPNDLFIAIHTGHQYIQSAVEKGAYVISEQVYDHDRVFVVKDTVIFLGEIAKHYRQSLSATVIGVTGSVGKTSLTQFLYQALSKHGKCVAPIGNQNNEIGLPLTILRAQRDTRYLIVEMGVARQRDMDWLGEIAKPDIGIITEIGPSHLKGFGNRQGVWAEKSKLINYSQKMIVNKDAIDNSLTGEMTFFGKNAEILIKGDTVIVDTVTYQYDLEGVDYRIYVYAAAHAVFKCLKIRPNFSDIVWPAMRMERRTHSSGADIIIDCYNANLISYIAALQYIVKTKEPVILLGEMTDLGDQTDHYHAMLGRVLNYFHIDHVVMYGKNHQATLTTFLGDVVYISSKEGLQQWVHQHIRKGMTVLVKGGRHIGMETILSLESL